MALAPAVPFGGVAGLRFLDRTYEAQFAAFTKSPDVEREVRYFLDHAAGATTAADLVADRRLLRVALGAFGLEDEIDKRAFIRRVLEEGSLDPEAFANRLADPAWGRLAKALGYGDFGSRLVFAEVRQDIVSRFRTRQFERAIGEQDVSLRLALNFRREIAPLAAAENVESAGWFRILGSKPLRRVFEGAYGLPTAFAQLDIERQREVLAERTARLFGGDGSPALFTSAEAVEGLLNRFLTRAALEAGPGLSVRGSAALSLLSAGGGLGPAGRINLLLSNLRPL